MEEVEEVEEEVVVVVGVSVRPVMWPRGPRSRG